MLSFQILDGEGDVVSIPNLTFDIESFNKNQLLGEEECTINLNGTDTSYYDLIALMGNNIRVIADNGEVVWKGYIESLTLSIDGQSVTISLTEIRNKVKALYQNPRGMDLESEWIIDLDSVEKFDAREEIYTGLNNFTPDEAVAYISEQLGYHKDLHIDLEPSSNDSSSMLCRGYGEKTKHIYYRDTKGLLDVSEQDVIRTLGKAGFQANNVGFYRSKETNYIYDFNAELGLYRQGEKFVVSGSNANDGTYTIKESFLKKLPDGSEERFEPTSLTASEIGYVNHENKYIIFDTLGRLDRFYDRKLIRVRNSVRNDGIYTIKSYNPEAVAFNQTLQLGFRSVYEAKIIYSLVGQLQTIEEGNAIAISGANEAMNNRTFTVVSNDKRSVRTHTSTSISIDGADSKIHDINGGLEIFQTGDIVQLTGSSIPSNNNVYRIISVASNGEEMKIDSEYATTEVEGANITLTAGNQITVNEATHEEDVNTVTIQVGSYIEVEEPISSEHETTSTISIGEVATVEEEVTTEYVDGETNVLFNPYGFHYKQNFQVSHDTYLRLLEVPLRIVGEPELSLEAILYDENNYTLQNSLPVTPDRVGESLTFIEFEFDDEPLTAGLDYYFVVKVIGSESQENHYEIGMKEENRTGYQLQAWGNGSYRNIPENISFNMMFVKKISDLLTEIESLLPFSSGLTNLLVNDYKTFYYYPEYISIYDMLEQLSGGDFGIPRLIVFFNDLMYLEFVNSVYSAENLYIQDRLVIKDWLGNLVRNEFIVPARWLTNRNLEQKLGIDIEVWIKQVTYSPSDDKVSFVFGEDRTVRQFWGIR